MDIRAGHPGIVRRKISARNTDTASYAEQFKQQDSETGIQVNEQTRTALKDRKYVILVIQEKGGRPVIGSQSPPVKQYPVAFVIDFYFRYRPLVSLSFKDGD